MKINKVLIIRFSSFGDIIQCSKAAELIAQINPAAEIHWVTRGEFKALLEINPKVKKVWSLSKENKTFLDLVKLGLTLRKEKYDLIYDAHNNLRSNLLFIILRLGRLSPKWVTRSKDRIKRIMLFQFRLNFFNYPFKGIDSFLTPIKKVFAQNPSNELGISSWNFSPEVLRKLSEIPHLNESVIFVPSAAWTMKRWPVEHWITLASLIEKKIIILGGNEDEIFCNQIKNVAPERIENLAGKLSLIESCAVVKHAELIISADTGLLHVADVFGKKALSLMGPTAFGFTTHQNIKTLEIDMKCRPCSKDGRGKCHQPVYQRCMVDITPKMVAHEAHLALHE